MDFVKMNFSYQLTDKMYFELHFLISLMVTYGDDVVY